MNDLTARLLAEGYDQHRHPDYVMWESVGKFSYTYDFLKGSNWQTGCGLYLKFEIDACGSTGYNGVLYCPENNNHLIRCKTPAKEADCPHAIRFPFGYFCPIHLADRYDYQNSIERLKKEYDRIERQSLEEMEQKYPGFRGCACRDFDRITHKVIVNYNPANCLANGPHGCLENTCYITGKSRDVSLANIYYDLRITYDRQKGFLAWTDTQIIKGIRYLSGRRTVTALEEWLRVYPDGIEDKERGNRHHQLYFSYGAMKIKVENIRIEKRVVRDLAQDIQDAREGILVIHDSEAQKKRKDLSRQRRQDRLDAERKRDHNRRIKELVRILDQPGDSPDKADAWKQLQELGVEPELLVRKEQMRLLI